MKKLLAALAIAGAALMNAAPSSAIGSAELLNQPERYRVIGVQNDAVIYADTASMRAIQTMDYPGSIENISCTLYAETYAASIDDMAFHEGRLVSRINEYDAVFHANKQQGEFSLDARLTGAYKPDGQAYEIAVDTIIFQNIRDLFINAHRAAMLPKA